MLAYDAWERADIAMQQTQHVVTIRTGGQGLHEVTDEMVAWLAKQSVRQGLLTIFIRHTSASILIQENADPDVQRDLEAFFKKLVPEDLRLYRHTAEGPDDMPAHIKGALTQTQISIPINQGQLGLGRYQGIYVFEHRSRPHARELLLHLIGQ
jgi:secondary thiamine-phosphate synthase enzyme